MRRYWLVGFWKNGFEGKMLIYGSEQELRAYLNSEIGGGDERHTMIEDRSGWPSRWWEPGAEDAPEVLPEDQWLPDDEELPFE